MKQRGKKYTVLLICLVLLLSFNLTGCGKLNDGKRIVRISLGQSETHPQYLGLLAFKDYVEERLGDKYEIQIFPNEILGATQKAIELTQTGMQDEEYMRKIYSSTEEAGFEVLTWYSAGTRNFYAKKPIYTPDDLKGMKIRVQQSPASVKMMQAFGAAATPMSFGEVYTAIQQGVIDGAENNELALTNNKHGEVAKYFTYNMHQMIPDMLVGNLKFLKGLSEEELQIFKEAAALSTEVELEEWNKQVEKAKTMAKEEMNVEFIEVDIEQFKAKMLPLHQEMLEANPAIVDAYQHIQEMNKKVKGEE